MSTKTNKILSLLLVLCMVFSLSCTGAFADTTYASVSTLDAETNQAVSGTTYTISDDDDMAAFTAYVNGGGSTVGATFKLTANVKATAVIGVPTIASDASTSSPYVTGGYSFDGTFDGNDKTVDVTIKTSASGTGLFGYVSSTGVVENLNVEGTVDVSGSVDAVGGVVGYNSGIINNVVNNADVTATSAYNVGGIAGFNDAYYMSTDNGYILNSTNSGCIKGGTKVGGIVGENAGTINSCFNIYEVIGYSSSKNGVGGIAGRAGNNNTAKETSQIYNCYNTGSIKAGSSGTGKWAGGICGFLNSLSVCVNCYNVAPITATSYFDHISGNTEGTVTNCYGRNDISVEGYDGAIQVSIDYMRTTDFLNDISKGTTDIWGLGALPYPLGNATASRTAPSVTSYTVAMTSSPTKLSYIVGETFDPTGMAITATDTDGNTTPITDYTYTPSGALTADDTTVTVSCTYGGISYSFTISITVTSSTTGGEVVYYPGGSTTLAEAIAKVGDGGTVFMAGTEVIEETVAYYDSVTFAPYVDDNGAAFAGPLFQVKSGTVTFGGTSMVLQGTSSTDSSTVLIAVTGGTVRLRGGVTLQSCGTAVQVNGGTLQVNKTKVSANDYIIEYLSGSVQLNDYGSTTLNGTVYLAKDLTLTVQAAIPSAISVVCASASDELEIAVGSGYVLTEADANKVTYAGTGYSVELDLVYDEDTGAVTYSALYLSK